MFPSHIEQRPVAAIFVVAASHDESTAPKTLLSDPANVSQHLYPHLKWPPIKIIDLEKIHLRLWNRQYDSASVFCLNGSLCEYLDTNARSVCIEQTKVSAAVLEYRYFFLLQTSPIFLGGISS